VSARHWILTLAVALPLAGSGLAADRGGKNPAKETFSFGTLKAQNPEMARAQSEDWLKGVGKTDAATLKEVDKIWAESDRSVLDRVAATLGLGEPAAAKLLKEAHEPATAAPKTVPALIKDVKRPVFFRANLALAYAKALSGRRVFEESLESLRAVKPEHVVDPASYFFHRAVAEHAMLLKNDAIRSLIGLTEDVLDTPERYKMVGALMYHDMLTWRDKDLGAIARKMDNIERRLDLSRGGPQTQKLQRDVIARLDELIKELEKPSNSNGGACPSGCPEAPGGGTNQPSSPMKDSNIATNGGPGNIDPRKLKGLAQAWGKLPDKERAKAMQDLIQGMPARHREVIENYFRKLAQSQANQP
jgi:hypothetical protein